MKEEESNFNHFHQVNPSNILSKNKKACKIYRFLIKDGKECLFCKKSYPVIWNHLSTRHEQEIAQIQRCSISIIRVDSGKKEGISIIPKSKDDQFATTNSYQCKISGKQMEHLDSWIRPGVSYSRRQKYIFGNKCWRKCWLDLRLP